MFWQRSVQAKRVQEETDCKPVTCALTAMGAKNKAPFFSASICLSLLPLLHCDSLRSLRFGRIEYDRYLRSPQDKKRNYSHYGEKKKTRTVTGTKVFVISVFTTTKKPEDIVTLKTTSFFTAQCRIVSCVFVVFLLLLLFFNIL